MNKKVIFRGASAIMPLCIGDFPFSFIVGALSVSAGMSVWQSTAWSAIVIAGSAQMLALNMLKTGATLAEFAKSYFDYEKFARDLFMCDYWMDEGFVFRAA